MAKAKTKNVLRTILAIIYLIFGAVTVWQNWKVIASPSLNGILTLAMGVILCIAGFIALFGGDKKLCRVLGVIIFIVSVVALILNWFSIWGLIGAILAWGFIALIK